MEIIDLNDEYIWIWMGFDLGLCVYIQLELFGLVQFNNITILDICTQQR
jgi:hypothetical protein